MNEPRRNDERTTGPPADSASISLEGRWVHRCLLTGVLLSGPLLLLGLILTLARSPAPTEKPGEPPPPVVTILRQAATGDGSALIQIGLLALMITPILRVATLAVLWTIEPGAKRFALTAGIVLVLLAVSIALGFG